ncbi:hypothetical protein BH09PLA1_BH09PLA1_12300 [soil metagenome]
MADTLLVRGQYAIDQAAFNDAQDAFLQAREIHSRLGKTTLPDDFGLYGVFAHADPPQAILETLQQGIPWLSYADDGKTLISATATGSIEWDVASRRRLREFPFQIMGISPDQKTLYVVRDSNRVVAMDRQTLVESLSFEHDETDVFCNFTVSPDGRWLVGCHSYRFVSVWDARTGKRLQKLNAGVAAVRRAEFSRDAARMIIATPERVAEWETSGWTQQTGFAPRDESGVEDVALSPDGGTAAVAFASGRTITFDLKSGKAIQQLDRHMMEVQRSSYSPDGKWLVTVGDDAAVRVWNSADGTSQRLTFGHRKPVSAVAFAPDSRYFSTASVDGEIRIWDLQPQQVEVEVSPSRPSRCYILPFSPDDRLFLYQPGDDKGPVEVWDTANLTRLCILEATDCAMTGSTGFTPDSTRIRGMKADDSGAVCEWDAQTGRKIRELMRQGSAARGFLVTPDDQIVVTFGDESGIIAWEMSSNRILWERNRSERAWRFCAMSPDGAHVGILTNDGKVQIVRTADGSSVRSFETVRSPTGFAQLAFLAGRADELVWGHDLDNRPHLMNFVSGKQSWVAGEQQRQLTHWSTAGNGAMLAVGISTRQIEFTNTSDGKPLFSVMLPKAATGWAFSPHMTRLAYKTSDERVWIADLTAAPRLADLQERRPTNGKDVGSSNSSAGER